MRDIPQFLSINGDPSACNVVKTIEQPRDGRLACARWANNRQRLAGFDFETDAIEYLALGVIGEMYIFKHHSAALDRKCRCIWFVGDFGGRVDEIKHCSHVSQALAYGAIDHAQHVQWPEKLRQQGIHGDHVACGKLPA